jgi:hypothetical protein
MAAAAGSRWAGGEESKPAIAFKLAFCLAYLVASLYGPTRQWLGWRAAQNYVAVPVDMRKLELEARPYRWGVQDQLNVDYEYEVGGRGYRSKSKFLVDDFPPEHVRRRLYERLRKARDEHAPIMAWVDPKKPANVVLDRESYDDRGNFVIAGIAFAAFLFGAAYYFLPRKPKPPRKTARRLNRSW